MHRTLERSLDLDLDEAMLRYRWTRERWSADELGEATRRVLGRHHRDVSDMLLQLIEEHGNESEIRHYRAWAQTPESLRTPDSCTMPGYPRAYARTIAR